MIHKTNYHKSLPIYVVEALNVFKDNKIKAYVVGGAVRDLVRGETPKDYDIATEAPPEVVSTIFTELDYKVYHTDRNAPFGRVSVMVDGNELEITTFRTDGESSDSRHPDECGFNTNMEGDSNRRDFCCNALYLDAEGNLYDFHNGYEDALNGVVEFVGISNHRINEDHLRLLRLFRFCLRFDDFSDINLFLMKAYMFKLKYIAPERIKMEMEKIFAERKYNTVERLFECRVVDVLFGEKIANSVRECKQITKWHPEVSLVSHINLFYNNLIDLGVTDPNLMWVSILHDLGKPKTETVDKDIGGATRTRYFGHEYESVKIAEDFMDKYKFSNAEKEKTLWLIGQHMRVSNVKKMKSKKLVELLRSPYIRDLCTIHSADDMIEEISSNSIYIEEKLVEYEEKLKPVITGKDLILHNFKPGEHFGEMLKECEEIQYKNDLTTVESIMKAFLNKPEMQKYKKWREE